jgi:FlaA1/EpsC-like NDP-sugar epimerase
LKPLTFYFFGLYRRMWSYASVQKLKLVFFAVTASSVLVSTVMVILGAAKVFQRPVAWNSVIDWLFTLSWWVGWFL